MELEAHLGVTTYSAGEQTGSATDRPAQSVPLVADGKDQPRCSGSLCAERAALSAETAAACPFCLLSLLSPGRSFGCFCPLGQTLILLAVGQGSWPSRLRVLRRTHGMNSRKVGRASVSAGSAGRKAFWRGRRRVESGGRWEEALSKWPPCGGRAVCGRALGAPRGRSRTVWRWSVVSTFQGRGQSSCW